ncbi:MAG: DUF6465 family protein [Defluviitaleaceae bacterium]|nr:DUF6465 family protein [Defluviitaleaceae bacterium]
MHKDIIDKIKDEWKSNGNFVKDILNIEIYYKPLENICYYVINSSYKGEIHM